MGMSRNRWKAEQERKRRERIRRARRRRNCAIAVVVIAAVVVCAIVMINKGSKPATVDQPSDTASVSVAVDSLAATNPYTTTRAAEDIKQVFFNDSAFAGNAVADAIGTYGLLDGAEFYTGINVDVENVYTTKSVGSTIPISEQFKSKRFKKVFLSFGEKELSGMTSTEFKNSYLKLVDKIEEYQPKARIYLIGIPPITSAADEVGDITMKKIREYNRRIMSIAVDEELYYIDSVDALGDNKGFLPNGVSYDGINLNKPAVIDLLYYMTKDAYIPDIDDLSGTSDDEDEEDEEDEEQSPTQKPTKSEPSPSPTVNVFKDKKGSN